MALSTRRLFAAILFLALFALAARNVADPDFWWHLRTGQYIVETGVIPHSDIFSFTNQGKEWVTHEWLSEVLIYVLYRAGGLPLLIVLFATLIALSFGLAYWRCTGRPYLAGFVVLLGAIATAPTWGVRPQMLSLFLTSLFLLLLDKYQAQLNWKYLLPLAPLTILWVNLHSGFALGLVIIAAYWVGMGVDAYFDRRLPAAARSLWTLALVLALCLIVVPLNPNGARMYTYPFETLTSPSMQRYIQEWFSPDFHLPEFQPFALLLLALIGGGILSRARIPAAWVLLVLLFGYAGLRSARNIPMLSLVAIPVLALQLTTILGARSRPAAAPPRPPRLASYLNALILILVAGAVALRVFSIIGNQSAVERARFPAAAVTFIQQARPRGNLYNTYGWGGDILWCLYPDYRVYIDGRADVYGDRFIEDYLNIYRAQPGWDEELLSRGVNLALVEPDSAIASALSGSSAWARVYADDHAVVFERKEKAQQ